MRPVKTALIPAAAALSVLLAGCSTNPVTGRSQLMVVPESMAISQSAAAYSSMMGGLSKKKQVETGTARADKVREITDRLVAQAVRFRPDSAKGQWEVQLINDPKTVNAFCMAGGKMAIYSGMWEKLKATDDEIAQMMGHEIGHALANHTQERMSIAYSTGIGTELLAIALGAQNQTAALMQVAAVTAIQLPNSRESESASSSPRAPATTRRPRWRCGTRWASSAASRRSGSRRTRRPSTAPQDSRSSAPRCSPTTSRRRPRPARRHAS